MRSARALRLLAAAALPACSDSTGPPVPCSGEIPVTVATTTEVRFSWTPRCGISRVAVTALADEPGEEERIVWLFTVAEERPIGPPVTYGESPPGATVWVEPEGLELGEPYRVEVMLTVGGDVLVASGESDFTWFPPD